MLFNSVPFLIFFAVVWPAYWLLRRSDRQNALLLVASVFFYGWWDWRFLGLLGLSIAVDYFCGRGIGRSEDRRVRRRYLLVSLVVNLGVLGLFKYFNFFVESFADLFGLLGWSVDHATAEIVLPVGISFYTFQTLSYTIDVYRGKLRPVDDPIAFGAYVSFFPQLVAGPIERASRLLPQLLRERRLTARGLGSGVALMVQGYFKKVVVADNLATLVDAIFKTPTAELHAGTVMVGVYAFAFQIYGDFSGYSDIARGLSRTLGIELMQNFDAPYVATSPQDFWRRWHISLSTWLRDYLYISLGGSRLGRLKTYRNLMITMVLGGLWHGAAWHFVAWGVFHGAILMAHRVGSEWAGSRWGLRPEAPPWLRGLRRGVLALLMFQVTCLGWLLFRARSMGQVGDMLLALGRPVADADALAPMAASLLHFAWFVVLLQVARVVSDRLTPESGLRLSTAVIAGYMGLHIAFEGVFDRATEFIYFQF